MMASFKEDAMTARLVKTMLDRVLKAMDVRPEETHLIPFWFLF
jgi:hypothetical protein